MSAFDLLAEIDRDMAVDPCESGRCAAERRGVRDWSPHIVRTACGVVAAVDAAYTVAVLRGVADTAEPVLQVCRERVDETTGTVESYRWVTVAAGADVFGVLPHGRGDEAYRVIYSTAG